VNIVERDAQRGVIDAVARALSRMLATQRLNPCRSAASSPSFGVDGATPVDGAGDDAVVDGAEAQPARAATARVARASHARCSGRTGLHILLFSPLRRSRPGVRPAPFNAAAMSRNKVFATACGSNAASVLNDDTSCACATSIL
jgi:hypothetical protein